MELQTEKIEALFKQFCPQSPFSLSVSAQESLESTNTSLLEEARNGANQGRVIIAENQSAGRGRKNRAWESPPYKNISLSILLTPPTLQPTLTLLASLAFCKVLKNEGVSDIWLKWPNDLWIKNKKIAGILSEANSSHLVLGLGLNVNSKLSDFSEPLRSQVSSLYLETQKVWDRSELTGKLLASFAEHYKIFLKQGFLPFKKEWEKHSFPKGKRLKIKAIEQIYEGEYQGLSETGALLLKTKTGMESILEGDLCF